MFADRPGGLVYTSKLKPGAAGHKEERRLKWRRRLPGPQISISNLNLKSQTSDLNLTAGQTHPTLLEASRLLSQYSRRKSPNLSSQISRLEAVQIFSLKSWISSKLDRRFLLVWEISFSKSLVSNLKVSHRRPSD